MRPPMLCSMVVKLLVRPGRRLRFPQPDCLNHCLPFILSQTCRQLPPQDVANLAVGTWSSKQRDVPVQVAALISVLASENNEVAGGTCSHVLNDLSLSHNLSISPCLSCTHLASALR